MVGGTPEIDLLMVVAVAVAVAEIPLFMVVAVAVAVAVTLAQPVTVAVHEFIIKNIDFNKKGLYFLYLRMQLGEWLWRIWRASNFENFKKLKNIENFEKFKIFFGRIFIDFH